MTSRRWIVTLGVIAIQFAGCATAPTIDVENGSLMSVKKGFAEKHERMARGYESSGSLRRALEEWRAISAVFPEASEPKVEIERLLQLISDRTTKHERRAKAALVKSDYDKARMRFLKMLALQPDNWEAIRALKKLEVKAGYARLASAPKVSSQVVQTYAAPTINTNSQAEISTVNLKHPTGSAASVQLIPSPANSSRNESNLKRALRYLSKKQYDTALAHFLLAREHKEASEDVLNKHIAYTRAVLAEQHYDNGVSAFRMASYDLAVAEFKKALEYNPQHQKARLYMRSASELQVRLAP